MDVIYTGGEFTVTLHQSDLAKYLLCPEQARQLWHGEAEDFTTGEAAIGTAFHYAVEHFLGGYPPQEALEAARERLSALCTSPRFRWVKVKTEATAQKHLATCWRAWYEDVYPVLGWPSAVEQKFDLPFFDYIHDDGQCDATSLVPVNVRLAGMIDMIEDPGTVIDWKTGSRLTKYTTDGWQLKRWGVQPGPYTWAAFKLGYAEPPVTFSWCAIERSTGKHAWLSTTRGPEDWSWLQVMCKNVIDTVLRDAPTWPINDQHALCSPDWCPAWNGCKGSVVAGHPQGVNEGEAVLLGSS